MRTAIYARKSTESEDRQVQSLEDQVRELKRLAAREGLRVVEVIEEARSAKEPGTRPEFERMLELVRAGEIEAILTWSYDRLSRNPVDGNHAAWLLQIGKLQLIRTMERAYRPEDNALLLSIENGMATAFIQNLRRNVKRGIEGRFERGWHNARPPIGYKNDFESKEVVIDAERFPTVRLAWDMLLSRNYTVPQIRKYLVEAGLTTRWRNKPNKLISLSRLYALFHNPFYAGKVQLKGEVRIGKHQAMVSEEEYLFAQSILNESFGSTLPAKRQHAFSGVFRCAKCGCTVVADVKTKHYKRAGRTAVYIYYHCSGHKGCSKRGIREESIELELVGRLSHLSLPPETAAWLERSTVNAVEGRSLGNAESLSSLHAEVDREERRLSELAVMRMDGELTPAEHMGMREQVLSRVEELKSLIHGGREVASRALRHLRSRINSLEASPDHSSDRKEALSRILKAAAPHYLNLETSQIELDPLLARIATFEPLKDGSEKPKLGDPQALFPAWSALVEELLTTTTDQILAEDYKAAKSKRSVAEASTVVALQSCNRSDIAKKSTQPNASLDTCLHEHLRASRPIRKLPQSGSTAKRSLDE